jgi:hypothetical protein
MYTTIRRKASLVFDSLLFFFAFCGAFAGGNAEKGPLPREAPLIAGLEAELAGNPGAGFEVQAAVLEPSLEVSGGRAESVMKALAAAFPDKIGPAEFRDGDWAVPVRGIWFYYADGRLLPEELREKAAEYDPQPFYTYPEELPPWKAPSAEDSQRMREMMEQRSLHPAKRSQHFYDELWRAHDRDESWDRVKQIRFLGHTVLVHYSILEELSLVEEQILKEAKTNAAVKQWISGIKSIDGWNWRNIAATASRSFHAYGAAIDLLPKSLGGAETYWQWTARTIPEWWTVPYSRRLHPPREVIKIFESFGFLWGGKWMTYDTMHFEYRPEILLYSHILLNDLR